MPVHAHAVGPPYWMTIIQDLNFGLFAVRNNLAQYTIIVAPDDTTIYAPEMIEATPAHRGEYLLEEWPINTLLDIDITDGVLTAGAGPSFSVTDFTYNPPMTGPTGTLTLYVGATLRTSGSGIRYETGIYNGTVDLTVNF